MLTQIGCEILEIIKDLGSFAGDILTTPYGKLRISKSTYYSAVHRFEKQGLVQRVKINRNRIGLSLTPLGKSLLKSRQKMPLRKDHLSTVILFDIPLEKSRERTVFRRYLERRGFVLLQKSALIANRLLDKYGVVLIEELHIKPYIKIIVGRVEYLQ